MAQVVCPVCQAHNPEFNPRCSSCGTTLGSGALSDVAEAPTTGSIRAPVASPSEIADLTGQTVSHYAVEKRLGQGGMGVVYQGTDSLLRRRVALKFLAPAIASDPRARSRFLREARAASRVDHPNVGTVYEIAEWQDQPFIAMACYEGETLRSRLQRGPLEFREAETIASQIASGLAAAHAAGVVHRDLKPANVFLTKDGQVKIVDFGLAHWSAEADGGSERLTEAGVVVGTVAYMSPEQARGEVVDHRTDLWSLGVVLYEMVTGASPFDAGNVASTLSRILNVEPPPLRKTNGREVPERLERLAHALLVKDRAQRLAKADDVVAALSGAVALPPVKRRLPWAAFGAGATVLAALLAGFVMPHYWKSATLPPRTASVVPLPCQVFGQPEFAYLADAVPATLSTVLAQVTGLDTRLPPKRIDVDKLGGDPARVAEAYQVERCVTCSVTATASRLHLAVQVIEPASRRVLWSQEYAGGPDAYLELARQAADGVRGALLPASRAITTYATLPGGSEAELAFQRGKYHSNLYNNLHQLADFEIALASFSRALELNPRMADAAAAIALLHYFRTDVEGPRRELVEAVERWARRALGMDERTSRAWIALAIVTSMKPEAIEPQTTMEHALRAAHLDPNDALPPLMLANRPLGASTRLCLAAAEESRRLDPLYLYSYVNVTDLLLTLDRPREALAVVDQSLRIEPNMPFALWAKVRVLTALDRPKEAAEWLTRLESLPPGRFPLAELQDLRLGLAGAAGDKRAADTALGKVLATFAERGWPEMVLGVLPPLGRAGLTEEVVAVLEKCAQRRVVPAYDSLTRHRDFKGLREHSRYPALAAQSRARFFDTLRLLEDARRRGELPRYLEAPLDSLRREFGSGG